MGKGLRQLSRNPGQLQPLRIAQWFALVAALSACTVSPPPTATFCDLARPLRLLSAEIEGLSTETLRQIDRHNSIGEQRCGWRA